MRQAVRAANVTETSSKGLARIQAGAEGGGSESGGWVPPVEAALSMPRGKRRSLTHAILWRLVRVVAVLFGRRRALSMSLNAARSFWRMGFELSGEEFGSGFHCRSMALSEDALRGLIPPGGSVLDVGCGLGRWTRVAAQHAASVVGIDLSRKDIEQARSLTAASNVEYVVGDVTSGLGDRRFSLALLIHVLEHIETPDGLLRVLLERAERLVVEVPDFESDPLNHVRLRLGLPFHSDADHVREYTADTLRAQLERSGWKVESLAKRGGAILALARHGSLRD